MIRRMVDTLAGVLLRASRRPGVQKAGEALLYYDSVTRKLRLATEDGDAAVGGSGGGGTSDHAGLTSLAWTSSGHTGTASRLAGFDSGGAAATYQIGADVQAYDAQLSAIAATTPSAGSIHTWSSSTSASVLAAGTEGQVLTMVSGSPAWRAALIVSIIGGRDIIVEGRGVVDVWASVEVV